MPKIQGTQRTVQTNTAKLTPPSTAGFGSSGAALKGVGNAIGKFAGVFDAFAATQEKNDSLDANMRLLEFSMDQDQKQFDAGRSIDGDGRDHINRSLNRYDTEGQQLLQTIPEKQRDKAKLSLLRTRSRIQNNAQGQQGEHQNEYWKLRGIDHSNNVIKSMVTPDALKTAGLDPAKAAMAVTDKAIDQMPITPSLKGAMKETNRKRLAQDVASKINPEQYFKMRDAKASTQKVLGRTKWSGKDIKGGIVEAAEALGVNPVDLATAISYETAGTFNPAKRGPRTQWGRHRGLIQFGEPQAKKYGVDWKDPVGSQLGANGAIVKYLRDTGVKKGMGLLDIYSAINAGGVGRYNRSDADNGGAPGTVRDKVEKQMAGHKAKAMKMLGGDVASYSARSSGDTFTNELFSKENQEIVQKRFKADIKHRVETGLSGKPVIQVEQEIDNLRNVLKQTPTHGAEIALKEAEAFKKTLDKGLKTDPLGYANDMGSVEVPLLFNEQNPIEGFQQRNEAAGKVADIYKIQKTLMRPEEKTHMLAMMGQMDPEQKLQLFAAIDKGFGRDAKQFFNELSSMDTGYAHIGGLYLSGNKETASLALSGLTAMQDKSTKHMVDGLKNADITAAFQETFGTMFKSAREGDAAGFIATGKAIATQLMLQGQFVNDPAGALKQGMLLASGYHKDKDGNETGGVGEWNGSNYLVPPGMSSDFVDQTFELMTSGKDEVPEVRDFRNSDSIVTDNKTFDFFLKTDGVRPINPDTQEAITAEQMHDAQFVSIGNGKYRILVDGLPLLQPTPDSSTKDGKLNYLPYTFDILKHEGKIRQILADE